MDPTTEDIFFSAETFEHTSSTFTTARGGMHGGKLNKRQQQQQQQQRRSDRRQHQQMDDEDEDEDDGELSDMLLSDIDSGIFFNEASVEFFGGGGGGGEAGVQKYHQGGEEGSGISTSKEQQHQQQEDGEYSSPVPSFPHALLSSKNVSSLPSTVNSGLSSFLAAGPPLWKQPAPGVSHHYQQQEEKQQQQHFGSQFQQSQQYKQLLEPPQQQLQQRQQLQLQQQQHQQLSVSMPGFGFEKFGTGNAVVEGMQGKEGGRRGKSESPIGLMDDAASILSSDASSIWGMDPQDGRGGGSDNTIPPQYQMNHEGYSASSLMMMYPSPGSSSARSAVSGVSSGSNSGLSNNSNGATTAGAVVVIGTGADGETTLLPLGAGEKAKTKAAGGGTRRTLGGGSSSSSSIGGGSGRGGGGGGGRSVRAQAQVVADARGAGADTTNVGGLPSSGAEGGKVSNGKRKQDRNAREQKRSLKISQQIGHLKTVLEKEGRKVKKNSKMAILLSVEDYIKELEEEVAGMTMRWEGKEEGREDEEAEYGGFGAGDGITTVAAGAAVARREREEEERNNWNGVSGCARVVTGVREGAEEREVASGVGYQLLFKQVSTPLAVASVDGKLIDANVRFEMASGYSKEELLRLTFFNLVSPEDLQTTFAAIARMINQGGEEDEDERVGRREEELLKLTKRAVPKGRAGGEEGGLLLYITISLVRQHGQNPSFFQCSLH
ncbi:Hypothetical protein NocV09_01501180 [Nannochloropsis oceanica]